MSRSRLGLITLVVMTVLTLVLGGRTVKALSEEELLEYSLNDIMFYRQCGVSSGDALGGDITISGSTAEEKLWSGLRSFLSDVQAAGIMGNIGQEDGNYNPVRREVGQSGNLYNRNAQVGLGFVQWSFGRRVNLLNYVKERDESLLKYFEDDSLAQISGDDFIKKVGDSDANKVFQVEIEFLKNEIDAGYKEYYNQTDVNTAAVWFREHFERAGVYSDKFRIEKANAAYSKYAGKEIVATSTESVGGSSDPSCNACAEGSKNINGAAVCLAWPLGTEKSKYSWPNGTGTDLFNEVYPKLVSKGSRRSYKGCDGPIYGASCDRFVSTVVRFSGYDKKFPTGVGLDKDNQGGYPLDHPDLWERIDWNGDPAALRAGDVVLRGGHVAIAVQDENGKFYIAEAGLCNTYGHIRNIKKKENFDYIIRAKNANNSTVGVDVENGVSTSSLTGTLTGGTTQGNGDIAASAIALAWPEGTPAKTYTSKVWDKFLEFFNSLPGHKNNGTGQTWKDGKSCMVFVNTVLQYAGALKGDKLSSVTPKLIKSDEWEEVGGEGSPGLKYSDLKSGDVLSYFSSDRPSDDATTYKGLGLQHEAIYVESSGKGMIIEAGYQVEWGHVREKKPSANKTIAGGWAPIVRVFRWKNQGGGSCNVCDEGDSAGGQLKAGGFTTVEEATAFMQSYIDAASPGGKYYNKTGDISFGVKNGKIHDAGCPHGVLNNCVAFSQWFVNNYTTVGPNWNNTTNGVSLVDALEKKGLKRGTEPRPYAIFSKKGPSSAGHTGVILGVNSATNKVIIGDAACNEGSGVFYKPRAYEKSFSEIKDWWYAYTDDVISMGGPLQNV